MVDSNSNPSSNCGLLCNACSKILPRKQGMPDIQKQSTRLQKPLNSQPLGLQSFLGKVVVIFTRASDISSCHTALSIILREAIGPWNHIAAIIGTLSSYYMSLLYCFSILLTSGFKYTSIYAGYKIEL